MNVEKATEADIGALVELRIAYLTEDDGPLDADVIESIRRDLPGYYRRHLGADLFVYVIRDAGSICSCAFLLVVEKPMSPAFITGRTGTVLNVYTRPACRRRGYARRLMQALLDDAQAMDLSVVELKATEDGYPLYRLVGFVDDTSKYHPMKWVRR
ncbi:MAG: GNAT family N-acetyltransferase [Coriobacteriales bacterium]|nr:GNAT family N-acetyltransferase [Coriobacteriales bacterium]